VAPCSNKSRTQHTPSLDKAAGGAQQCPLAGKDGMTRPMGMTPPHPPLCAQVIMGGNSSSAWEEAPEEGPSVVRWKGQLVVEVGE